MDWVSNVTRSNGGHQMLWTPGGMEGWVDLGGCLYTETYWVVICIKIYLFDTFECCCVDNVSVRDAVVSEAFLRFFVETCGHYTEYICTQQDGLRVFEVNVRSSTYDACFFAVYRLLLICFYKQLALFFLFMLGTTSSTKPKAPSFQIGSGWNLAGLFLQLKHINWWSQIFDLMSQFQGGGRDIISCKKVLCCHLASESETSAVHQTFLRDN